MPVKKHSDTGDEMMDESGDLSSTIAFGMAQDAVRQQQQQPERLAMPPQHQHQHQQPHQHRRQPMPARETYKSCDFCAKRKRKCSGDLPRCSLCIEKNQPYCHYKPKPPTKPTKPRAAKPAAARRRSSPSSTSSGGIGEASQLVGAADVAVHSSGGGAITVAGTRSLAMVRGSTSLKRCRLSASPATGLVGMQENGFLGDFFGCLGVLPLATESTIRSAMVEVMMGAVAPRQQYQHKDAHFGNGGLAMGGEAHEGEGAGTCLAEGEEEGWGRALVCRDVPGYSAKCIMWCAIALGALMRGSPVEYVAGYIRLARESLAGCFDGNSIENARAYLMMSFLHGIIRDEEKNEKYLSFAMNIVTKLGPDELPKDLGGMLLTAEKMRIFQTAGTRTEGDDLVANCSDLVDLPPAGDFMQEKDARNIFLVAERRLSQAFITDMFSQGVLVYTKEEVDQEGKGEHVTGDLLEQPGGSGMVGSRDERAFCKKAQLPVWGDPRLFNSWRNGPEPPPAGSIMKDFIQEALPELSRLSKTLKRSGVCSGVGGLLYHGSVAYMKAVGGDISESMESLEACTTVFVRYPGIVRFRPHLAHCILAASHHCCRQGPYNAVREVYNRNRPLGFARAPPFEEWTGMSQLCDHVFCRSADMEGNGLKAKELLEPAAAADTRPAAGCSSLSSSPSPAGVDPSWTGAGAHSSDSPQAGSGRASQRSSAAVATVAVTDTVASATSPLSEVQPEAPHVPGVLHQHGTTVCGAGAADGDLHHLVHFTATSALLPEPVTPAAAATDVRADVVEQSAATGQQPSVRGVEIPAGEHTPNLDLFEGEPGSEQGQVHLMDVDLLDVAAVFMEEEGLLEEGLLEEELV